MESINDLLLSGKIAEPHDEEGGTSAVAMMLNIETRT